MLCGVRCRRHIMKLCKAHQLSCGNGVLQQRVCVSKIKGWEKKGFLKARLIHKVICPSYSFWQRPALTGETDSHSPPLVMNLGSVVVRAGNTCVTRRPFSFQLRMFKWACCKGVISFSSVTTTRAYDSSYLQTALPFPNFC